MKGQNTQATGRRTNTAQPQPPATRNKRWIVGFGLARDAIMRRDLEFTLFSLAGRSAGKTTTRRIELMTRIADVERVAASLGDSGLFATITCPASMRHRVVVNGQSRANDQWDGTTARDASAYLSRVWARIRADIARKGVVIYGFRIEEPMHDGTPHLGCLIFYASKHDATVRSTIRKSALAVAGAERGESPAHATFTKFDPADAFVSGYVGKYVAKNTDSNR